MVIDILLYLKAFSKQVLLSLHIINKTLRELLFSRSLKLVWKIWLGNTGILFAKNFRRWKSIFFPFYLIWLRRYELLGLNCFYLCRPIIFPTYLAGIIIVDSSGIKLRNNSVCQQPIKHHPTSQYLLVGNILTCWNNAFQLRSQRLMKQHMGDPNNLLWKHGGNLEKVPSYLNICLSHYLMSSFSSPKAFSLVQEYVWRERQMFW